MDLQTHPGGFQIEVAGTWLGPVRVPVNRRSGEVPAVKTCTDGSSWAPLVWSVGSSRIQTPVKMFFGKTALIRSVMGDYSDVSGINRSSVI